MYICMYVHAAAARLNTNPIQRKRPNLKFPGQLPLYASQMDKCLLSGTATLISIISPIQAERRPYYS